MQYSTFKYPELDYLQLIEHLKGYNYPRDRITKLLASGQLIRIKKGLYVDPHSAIPYSKEILANLIYGPSYVSLEYALQQHGLIPEAVRVITSVTTKRKKRYHTPIGDFDYLHLPERYFSPGVEYYAIDSERGYMMAGPEKALFDMLYLHYPDLEYAEIEAHLFENMRIEEADFSRLDFSKIESLLASCHRRSIISLYRFIKSRSRENKNA